MDSIMCKRHLSSAAVAAVLLSASLSQAAPIYAYGDGEVGDVAALVGSTLTKPFAEVADAAGLALVIQYDHVQIGSDLICHASAGVSSIPADSATARIPGLRVAGARLVRTVGSIDIAIKRDCVQTIVREVARNLMQIPVQELILQSKGSVSGNKVALYREREI